MNKTRRKKLEALRDKLLEFQSSALEIKEQLDALRDEEKDAYDNMPESLQNSEKGLAMNSGIDSLDSVVTALEEIDSQLSDAVDAIENATNN